jgi:uncharacterized membrane protein
MALKIAAASVGAITAILLVYAVVRDMRDPNRPTQTGVQRRILPACALIAVLGELTLLTSFAAGH